MYYEQIKNILSSSILFITFTGIIHYIVSKFLEKECENKECENKECDNTNPINTNPINTNPINTNPINTNPINTISKTDEEKTKTLIKKKEYLEDLYLKLEDIKSKIHLIKQKQN